MSDEPISDFTAADVLPYKLLRDPRLIQRIVGGTIPPAHLQFYPTNHCNLNCSFCSCSEVDRTIEMPIDEVRDAAAIFADMGTMAVTLTGGGEPTMHANFEEVVCAFRKYGIRVGMVCNGTRFPQAIELLDWCRVSSSDERQMPEIPVGRFPKVGWAFSYVLTSEPDVDNLVEHIEFANAHGFTHVRVVRDILDEAHDSLALVRRKVRERVDDSRVLWQDRRPSFVHGPKECLASRLRPLLAADGTMYPCCSVQYAPEQPDTALPANFSMGHWERFAEAGTFDGSKCARCSYGAYNDALKHLTEASVHASFI